MLQKMTILNRLYGLVVLIFLLFTSTTLLGQLAPEYLRNGECYLLIGEGSYAMRGVFRLNNPEKDKYYKPVIHLFTPSNTFTLAVDLDRKIYTFTEQVESSYRTLSGNIRRQVVDTVSARHVDYGYHTWYHADHRNWGRGSRVYKTGPVNRTVYVNGGYSRWYTAPASAGPGIRASSAGSLPGGYSGALALGTYGGRNWYDIPNGSWYSAWKTGRAISNGFTTFYYVFGDKEEGKAHNWHLNTWTPNNISLDRPTYGLSAGRIVATSYDKRVTRQALAGCLDGCGGAYGSGSGTADEMVNDLAFMPPIKSQPARTYFYSRPENKLGGAISLNSSPYNPTSGNSVIGAIDRIDTNWIGVSMRDVSSDYVYALGNSVIRDWYTTVTGASAWGVNISAVAVSNQWNQEGGIVYAYDASNKMVYRFDRREKEGAPISAERYQALSMSSILNSIGAVSSSQIDDIKADGFGNLYFALSHPAKSVAQYDPRRHFKMNQAMAVNYPTRFDSSEPPSGQLIFRQAYGKKIFKRDILDASVTEMGSKDYAVKYYNVTVRMEKPGWDALRSLGSLPDGSIEEVIASWTSAEDCSFGNGNRVLDYPDFQTGSVGMFPELSYSDPGKCRIAVINVPTPPNVLSLYGKHSYLDIIGPYVNTIPVYDASERSTNQSEGLIKPTPETFSPDTLYFYMVENYPLPDGAQNPNTQSDWDGDGRPGGFVSSLVNPKSSRAGGKVYYRWRTWMVEDLYGMPILKAMNNEPPKYPANTGQDEYYYFYSPIPGKYIITCSVSYDWYDYDSLAFGDTIADLQSKAYKSDAKAIPAYPGTLSHQRSRDRLNGIMGTEAFEFMTASASTYINSIIGGDEYQSIIPIVVAGDIPPKMDTLDIARIQRCDEVGKEEKDGWFPTSGMNPAGGFHGIAAGRRYSWRIDNASQTNICFDISGSVNTTPGAENYNYVADMMQKDMGLDSKGNEKNPFFVNRKENFKFRNQPGDLKWVDTNIRVTAHLEYKVPNDGGTGWKIEKKFLTQNPAKPGEPEELPAIIDRPIITGTMEDLPPTDPYDAELVITMRRMFEYKIWLQIEIRPGNFIWASYLTLPKEMILTGKTTVKIIDVEAPKIVFRNTAPNNLFGETGKILASGVGPEGQRNPDFVRFTMNDNNPWEAIKDVVGITSEATYNDNKGYNDKIIAENATHGAKKNLRPVFAKNLSRKVSIGLETASRILDKNHPEYLSYEKVRKLATDDLVYEESPSQEGFRIIDQSFFEENAQGLKIYQASMTFSLPIEKIVVGANNTRKIPVGYANNTPGYEPYKFRIAVRDSSGNAMPETELNLALNVKDIVPPFQYAIVKKMKDNTTSRVPDEKENEEKNEEYIANMHRLFSLNENIAVPSDPEDERIVLWESGAGGNIIGTPYYALPHLDTEVVIGFSDTYRNLIDIGIPLNPQEDNIEVLITTGVSDNAGIATGDLRYKFLDALGRSRESERISSSWDSTGTSTAELASSTASSLVVFRGRSSDFPMIIPIEMEAEDNAREWSYYNCTYSDNFSFDWDRVNEIGGEDTPRIRRFNTSMPVYGSKFIIRTIDKSLRNN